MKFLYSEIFGGVGNNPTFQGEGYYTGTPTLWLRLFGCNLQCDGFGQKHPTKPETWNLPYRDLSKEIAEGKRPEIKKMEDLPVFSTGCDSSYSWSAGFKKLQRSGTAKEIADRLIKMNTGPFNPEGAFIHPKTGQSIHLCFTGGEPLMPRNQMCVVEVLKELISRGEKFTPSFITFETNGTWELEDHFVQFFHENQLEFREVLFSVSPKLWTVSGEPNSKAIRPEVVESYASRMYFGSYNFDAVLQLKFVVGTNLEQWEELDKIYQTHFKDLMSTGYDKGVWIMPAGATEESQREVAAEVAEQALKMGFNVAARVHAYVFANVIGK